MPYILGVPFQKYICKSNLFANPTEIAQVSNKYNQLYTTAFKLASRHHRLEIKILLRSYTFPMEGEQVRSLVRELRPHMLHSKTDNNPQTTTQTKPLRILKVHRRRGQPVIKTHVALHCMGGRRIKTWGSLMAVIRRTPKHRPHGEV